VDHSKNRSLNFKTLALGKGLSILLLRPDRVKPDARRKRGRGPGSGSVVVGGGGVALLPSLYTTPSMRIPVSLKNESKNDSLRPGAAINSARTVAVVTRLPRPSAASNADWASGANAWIAIPECHFPTEPG
jgi:hypothetical protein